VVYKKVQISKRKEVKGMRKFLGVSLAVGALAIAGAAVAQMEHGSGHNMHGDASKTGHEMKSHMSKAGHEMQSHTGQEGQK
jgi:hypothetical protein